MKLRTWFHVPFVCLALVTLSCAHRMGEQSTSGALSSFAAGVDAAPGERPAEAVARRAVEGAVTELSQPEEQARINAVMTGAADSFQSALTQGLTGDLGAHGDGPLAQSLAGTMERAAAGATRGAMETLLATCDPQDPHCLDRRISELSAQAATAFVGGVTRSLGLAPLVVAFAAGAGSVLLLGALWWLLRGGNEPRSTRRDRRAGEAAAGRRPLETSPTTPSAR